MTVCQRCGVQPAVKDGVRCDLCSKLYGFSDAPRYQGAVIKNGPKVRVMTPLERDGREFVRLLGQIESLKRQYDDARLAYDTVRNRIVELENAIREHLTK